VAKTITLVQELLKIKEAKGELSKKEEEIQKQIDDIKNDEQKSRIQVLIDHKDIFLQMYPDHTGDGLDETPKCQGACQRCQILQIKDAWDVEDINLDIEYEKKYFSDRL
jgi:hypothetical protein